MNNLKNKQVFLKKLSKDKIKMNWNKNPIKMDMFLSFLTIDVTRSSNHLGCCNGWTQLVGMDGLIIKGGVVNGIEYLDSLEYGKNLDNPYNNFINPFYLFQVLNNDGKAFFLNYYAEEIKKELYDASEKLKIADINKKEIYSFYEELGFKVK